jgi:hypothetical protein
MLAGNMLAGVLVAAVCMGGTEGCITGLERLNADFISCCGDGALGCGGGEETAAGAGGGEERPNRSFDKGIEGGLGLAGGDANPPNPPNPWSCPFEEIEVVLDCCFVADMVGEVRLPKISPPAESVGEVILGVAGMDLTLPKLERLAKGAGFSAGLGGGEVVEDGKLNPLKASVKPPMFEDADGPVGEAMSPKELFRSCWVGGGGCGFEYNDRIDCFRSGRDIPLGAAGVDAVLVGRLPAAA